ncbi:MAG: DUF2066 domain-containing protein [Parvibaculaceae bacterium]|nr:DUF2066 domain-containing protein [Parvibaculaceae bacterium]
MQLITLNKVSSRLFAALIVACTVLTMGTSAQAGDIFRVTGVPIDATAQSAAAARTQAVASGQKKALDVLLKRLTIRSDWALLPQLDETMAQGYVGSFQVAGEKSSSTRYLANLTVTFNGPAVGSLLRQTGLHYADTQARPTVLLTGQEEATGVVLWDETSPWRQAWSRVDTANSLTPLIMALGDIEDITSLPVSAVEAGNLAAFNALADRYGTNRVLFAKAEFGPAGTSIKARYALYIKGTSAPRRWTQTTMAREGEDKVALSKRAARRNISRMEADWKSRSIITSDERSEVTAAVSYETLKGWVGIQKRLKRVPAIQTLNILAVSTGGALVDLEFAGTPESLNVALIQQDLSLTDVNGNWFLASTR